MTTPAAAPPSLELTLTPQVTGGAVTGVAVQYRFSKPDITAGSPICRLPRTIVGLPGAHISALRIADDTGDVPILEEDEPATPSFTYRRWLVQRDTLGDVRVSYLAPVRTVDARTNNGPLFDLRAEAGGLDGAGITFLALPDTQHDYSLTLSWDLSQLPPGSRAACSLGDGTVQTTATAERMALSFYMAGPFSSHPAEPSGPISMYWLTQPPFDTRAVAERIDRIYRAMCEFFREPEPGHRVFIRKHPYRGNGGTGFYRSFAFGHSDAEPQTVESLTNLLAHETAHNWPRLDGEHGDIAWYSEGTAEYYSILLPYRAGIISEQAYLSLINERAHSYYTNPLQKLSNVEAAQQFWHDNRAQRVPYGRGLFYLIDVNAKIRARSGGDRSVDDLVLEILNRQRAGEKVGVDDWIDLVAAELGDDGRTEFTAMTSGQWVIPAPDALGPRFTRHDVDTHVYELGFAPASLSNGVVAALVPGSAAERAGIRDGDRIIDGPAGSEVARGEPDEITLSLQRNAHTLRLTYHPHGAPVRSYAWEPRGTGSQ